MKAAEFVELKKRLDSEILSLTEECLDIKINFVDNLVDENKKYKLERLNALSTAASYLITLDPDL